MLHGHGHGNKPIIVDNNLFQFIFVTCAACALFMSSIFATEGMSSDLFLYSSVFVKVMAV